MGTAAWPAASHWCVSRGWCRQLRFWLRVWSSQLGRRPWLAACPRGHSLHHYPQEAGASGQISPQECRRGHQQLQDPRLVQERHVRGGLSPPIVRARRARDTSGRTAQTRARPGTGKQTQSQTKDRTAGQQAQNQTQTWTQDCVTRQTTTAGSYSNCSRGPESVRLSHHGACVCEPLSESGLVEEAEALPARLDGEAPRAAAACPRPEPAAEASSGIRPRNEEAALVLHARRSRAEEGQ